MPLAVDGAAPLPESREARTDGELPSGSIVAGEVSVIDAGSAFVGPEDLASKRRRPWDVALAKRLQARAEDVPGTISPRSVAPGTRADVRGNVRLGDAGRAGLAEKRARETSAEAAFEDEAFEDRRDRDGSGDDLPRRGDAVFVVPEHVCPTVNLAEHAIVLDGGELVGVMDVEARGHELVPPDLPPAISTRALRKAAERSE